MKSGPNLQNGGNYLACKVYLEDPFVLIFDAVVVEYGASSMDYGLGATQVDAELGDLPSQQLPFLRRI